MTRLVHRASVCDIIATLFFLVLLAGCAAPERTPIAVTVPPTQAVALIARVTAVPTTSPVPRTIVRPTGPTETASPEPTETSTPTETPFPSPTIDPLAPTPFATPARAFQEPRFVDTLPIDQPWIWDYHDRFLSVDRVGTLSQLRLSPENVSFFDHWISRSGKTPLILETSDTQPPALFDPTRGKHITLDVPLGTLVSGFIVSPDSRQIVFLAVPPTDGENRVLIANAIDGTIHTVLIHDLNLSLRPIAWQKNWLYLDQGESPDVSVWRLNLTLPHARPELVVRTSENSSYRVQPNGHLLLLMTQDAVTPQLIDLYTGKGISLDERRCATGCNPLFSPDGKQIVYITDPDSQGMTQLVSYNIARGKAAILHTFERQASAGRIFWLDNGRHMLVQTVSVGTTPSALQQTQASLFATDGTLLDESSPDWARLQGVGYAGYLPLTNDNQQMVIDMVGGRPNLRALPFHAGDTPRFPPVWLRGDSTQDYYEVIYVPPK